MWIMLSCDTDVGHVELWHWCGSCWAVTLMWVMLSCDTDLGHVSLQLGLASQQHPHRCWLHWLQGQVCCSVSSIFWWSGFSDGHVVFFVCLLFIYGFPAWIKAVVILKALSHRCQTGPCEVIKVLLDGLDWGNCSCVGTAALCGYEWRWPREKGRVCG